MKIGIITFHWATNYGAVLQAYALQQYLFKLGHDVRIIDYVPKTRRKTVLGCFRTRHPGALLRNLCEYRRERLLQRFRRKHFRLSDRFSSYGELKKDPPRYDVYICGSDQIWHYSFTERGEHRPTYGYFLGFGSPEVKRIAYAASFGCVDYPEEVFSRISPFLEALNAISVREISGIRLVHEAGVEHVSLVPDPTLLLSEKEYTALLPSKEPGYKRFAFFYVLHQNQDTIDRIKMYFVNTLSENVIDSRLFAISESGIEQWLWRIKAAETVVTNSFHGTVFSIIFKKRFIVNLVEGMFSGMNDRVYTLLQGLGLESRLIKEYDEDRIRAVREEPIDWDAIEEKISNMRHVAKSFLDGSLTGVR